ncbi:uncharacterized protein PG998_005640 [Apiospora kogelbergensis]|uniref:uncharacterized protein n=1 Tax=Apiospora kogelbergensis TaxID=1337665 RepID=UPI00312E77DF
MDAHARGGSGLTDGTLKCFDVSEHYDVSEHFGVSEHFDVPERAMTVDIELGKVQVPDIFGLWWRAIQSQVVTMTYTKQRGRIDLRVDVVGIIAGVTFAFLHFGSLLNRGRVRTTGGIGGLWRRRQEAVVHVASLS